MPKSTYYRGRRAGLMPAETPVSPNRSIITRHDEKMWDEQNAHGGDTESKLIAKMKAKRVRKARKAVAAALAAGNHVSQQRLRRREGRP
jgi:hypothetical protein